MYQLLVLSEEWIQVVKQAPPIAMGGDKTARVVTNTGKEYLAHIGNNVFIFYVKGQSGVPFSVEDIRSIRVTNEMIDFDAVSDSWASLGTVVYEFMMLPVWKDTSLLGMSIRLPDPRIDEALLRFHSCCLSDSEHHQPRSMWRRFVEYLCTYKKR